MNIQIQPNFQSGTMSDHRRSTPLNEKYLDMQDSKQFQSQVKSSHSANSQDTLERTAFMNSSYHMNMGQKFLKFKEIEWQLQKLKDQSNLLCQNNNKILKESKFDASSQSLSPNGNTQNQIFPKALQDKMMTPGNTDENGSFSCATETVGKLTPLKLEYSAEVDDEI